ncbi:MAG: twin-arginine translocase subunit TatC [Limisphaerales bacterium]
MDPNAIAPTTSAPEEPRSEYHSPDGYDHSHHHDTYHDHHHGPGEDPYHYQYDEHHHGQHHHDHAGEHSTDHYGVPAVSSSGGGGTEETIDPLFDEKPGEGGPVKPFLEHLEDLRWVIIKVAISLLIGMTFCLFAADRIVAIFKWPLERSTQISPDPRQHISVMFGPKEVINFKVDPLNTNRPPGVTNFVAWPVIPTNRYVELELVPLADGTNQTLTLRVRKVSEQVPFEKAKPIIYKGIAAPFINSLHIAFFGGLLLAFPFVGFFLVQFILPALREKERKYFIKAMVPATLLFTVGVCLCYFLILPLALRAADQYAAWMGVDIPFLEADEYFGFCIKFMIGMGAGFEMPVILLALVKIGLLDYAKLAGFRRYMILINLILGALLTTPEVLTQVAMFIPLQILYELTIWIAWYWEQPDRALARRRLIMVIFGFVLFGVLCFYAWRYGWPWLMTQWKPAQ